MMRIPEWSSCSHLPFISVCALTLLLSTGCSTLPPGSNLHKAQSYALNPAEKTHLGDQVAQVSNAHAGNSGFRIITAGEDAFLIRVQMINAAERTLDLQYYIFRGDETGRLITDALLKAADRGVRIRVLVDDGDTVKGDEQILALGTHAHIEIRIFNPFAYRGHLLAFRAAEFLFSHSRLDYRMHNKLMVVDNAVALVGGRNIGNQYFQVDPKSQFADDDVFAAGPIGALLSAKFDEYWNSRWAIPVAERQASAGRGNRAHQMQWPTGNSSNYVEKIVSGEPYGALISGGLPLVFAPARVICDSPDKREVQEGVRSGYLMSQAILESARQVQSELLIVTPYFIPAPDELALVTDLRKRNVHVGIVTNSLESTVDILAQAAYSLYRKPLLQEGVEIHEIRALLGNTHGSGQTKRISRYGNFGLHAKLFVFDRKKVFFGSMNYDQRSRHLNTEIGLIIDSLELAQQTGTRFAAMAQPANAYTPRVQEGVGHRFNIVWHTEEQGMPVEYSKEPSRSVWKRAQMKLLSRLPVDKEL